MTGFDIAVLLLVLGFDPPADLAKRRAKLAKLGKKARAKLAELSRDFVQSIANIQQVHSLLRQPGLRFLLVVQRAAQSAQVVAGGAVTPGPGLTRDSAFFNPKISSPRLAANVLGNLIARN